MFFGYNLGEIFLFPVKDAEARRHFLTGCLVSLAAFIIPILPYFLLYGYVVRLARQVLKGESPRMVAWNDWGGMIQDGAKLFSIRIIYSLPLIMLAIPMFIVAIGLPFFLEGSNPSEADAFFALFMAIMLGSMCIFLPFSLAVAVFVPAAEMHMLDKNEFAAGFRVREWWAIFRANISGFIAALAIYFIATMVMSFALQIIMATLILACLLPILMPALTMYMVLVLYVPAAQAYRDGKARLAQNEVIPTSS